MQRPVASVRIVPDELSLRSEILLRGTGVGMATLKRPSLNELKRLLKAHPLDSLQVFRALGQVALDTLPDRKARYNQATLRTLGTWLQSKIPGVFPAGDLTARLQAAARVARAFTVRQIQRIDRRGTAQYRLRIAHLCHLASVPKTRAKWVARCFHEQWTVRQLHVALKTKYPQRSRGGRSLASPQAGLDAVLQAIQMVERYFVRMAEINPEHKVSGTARREALRLHKQCCRALANLKSAHLVAISQKRRPKVK